MLGRVADELREIGFSPRVVDPSNTKVAGGVVIFSVNAESGRYKGKALDMALSFQEASYPEYPPHFVHLKSRIATSIATKYSNYEFEGESWSAYSLPPSDFWDKLDPADKNMRTYYWRHILRIIDKL